MRFALCAREVDRQAAARRPLVGAMLIPAFTLELNNPILKGLAAVGKFDGRHPSLTCATAAGKVFFHSPNEKDPLQQIKFLNINRKISAVACGKLNSKLGRDVLLVGAQTTVLAYDVNENADLFYKDAPDGVNSIVVGSFGNEGERQPLALVGGNCSIQGFDHTVRRPASRRASKRRRASRYRPRLPPRSSLHTHPAPQLPQPLAASPPRGRRATRPSGPSLATTWRRCHFATWTRMDSSSCS